MACFKSEPRPSGSGFHGTSSIRFLTIAARMGVNLNEPPHQQNGLLS